MCSESGRARPSRATKASSAASPSWNRGGGAVHCHGDVFPGRGRRSSVSRMTRLSGSRVFIRCVMMSGTSVSAITGGTIRTGRSPGSMRSRGASRSRTTCQPVPPSAADLARRPPWRLVQLAGRDRPLLLRRPRRGGAWRSAVGWVEVVLCGVRDPLFTHRGRPATAGCYEACSVAAGRLGRFALPATRLSAAGSARGRGSVRSSLCRSRTGTARRW